MTQQAFQKAGYAAPSGFFAGQIDLVTRLAGLFGENTLMYAYFGGTAILRSMIEGSIGTGISTGLRSKRATTTRRPWTGLSTAIRRR